MYIDQSEASIPESCTTKAPFEKHLHSTDPTYQSLVLISVMSGRIFSVTCLIQPL